MGKVGDFIELFRKVDGLLQLEQKHGEAIQVLEQGLAALKDRVTALEAREGMLVVEAASAARTASNQVTLSSLSDLSRRLGRMEAAVETVTAALLAPPSAPAALPPPGKPARKRPKPG